MSFVLGAFSLLLGFTWINALGDFCAGFVFQFPSLGKGNRGICPERKQAFFATMAVFELPELRACGFQQDIKAFKVGSFLLLFSHFEVSNLNIA